MDRSAIASACLALAAVAPALAEQDACPASRAAPASRAGRRDGVLRPPAPLCDRESSGPARPFRFSGGATF